MWSLLSLVLLLLVVVLAGGMELVRCRVFVGDAELARGFYTHVKATIGRAT